ncbi:toll/interleukin-1 receptor domain-containing protein [Cryptosporangium minutisporangium]|uniref:TIR domain-containing protein n=1 Tax=Cryptosporangium minutisporangium TaxID=113569 RepID=A0ABP6TDT5_9ACTN
MGSGVAPGWDVFVSYTSADRKWAEWIAWVLEDAGLRVVVQVWDFVPGTAWVSKMDEAVRDSARTLAVCSPSYLSSSTYRSVEWQMAFRADPRGESRRLIPVIVRPCELPGVLGGLTWIDLTDRNEREAEEFLVAKLAAAGGRAKPERRPGLPGGVAVAAAAGSGYARTTWSLSIAGPTRR